MLRRTVLEAMTSTLTIGLGPTAAAVAAAIAPATGSQREEAFAASQKYCGVYRLAEDRMVGIDRFINDAGDGVLLFADYRTSVVRRLFQTANAEFSLGPSFDVPSPVELTARFKRDKRELVDGLLLRSANGAESTAAKVSATEEEVAFGQEDARLAGTLIVPEGPGPHPAVVLLHGSGPLTRYSFGPYRRFFNSLGLAVLAYDKRGTGASTGRRIDSSTGKPETLESAYFPDDLAADAIAARRFLLSRSEIDAGRIGFWGASEGGMLTTQVAAREQDIAFAIETSGFMGPLWKTLLYQFAAQMKAGGTPQADIAEAMAFNRFWMDVARTGEGYEEYLKRRKALIRRGKERWLFYYSGEFSSLAQMQWVWNHILVFDPLPALQHVRCPVLGLFGQADVLTDAAEASRALSQALAAGGNRDVTVKIFPGAGHSLMETPSRRGMAPGVFDTLRDWVLARA